jgi:hypothetical protein
MLINKHLVACVLILACLWPVASFAARGIGTTDGVATTDVIDTGYATTSTTTSCSAWIWITGAGGGNFGRIFDKGSSGTGTQVMYYDSAGAVLTVAFGWTTDGVWTVPVPSTGQWVHVLVTYDAGATANNPVIYLNGTSQTVTRVTGPTGTVVTNASNYLLGNRADNIRNWNGRLAEFAVWSSVLTSGNATSLSQGVRPDAIGTAPVYYLPLCGVSSTETNAISGGTSGTVTGTLRMAHPFANCPRPLTLSGAG